jgi:transposase InsO family protein
MLRDFKEFCDEHGIKREYTIPRTPQQNGVVERKNRTVQEMTRSMMNEKNIGQTYWVEAIHTTIHVLKKAHLRPQSDKTPYARPLMNYGLEDLPQSNTSESLGVNAT